MIASNEAKIELNKIYCGDCLEVMKKMDDCSVDLTVTSPPYDNLRTYNWYSRNFEWIAKELYRITKDWWVVVWVVWDATIKWSESGTSFRQALYFKEIGFNLHDTMIWEKHSFTSLWDLSVRYAQIFEYMFIFSKWKPKTFNPIIDRQNKDFWKKTARNSICRDKYWNQKQNNAMKNNPNQTIKEFWQRFNIWKYIWWLNNTTKDKIAFQHPAIFPEKLAQDHILSWSNEWDIVFDPFMWSWTTAKMAKLNNRNFIGAEISQEYVDIANERLKNTTVSLF